MTEVVERLVWKGEFDATDAERGAKKYEERVTKVQKKLHDLSEEEKKLAAETARLKKAQEQLIQAQIKGEDSARTLAIQAKVLRLENMKQADAMKKLRVETAALRQEEKALETERRRAERAAAEARRAAQRQEAAIARDMKATASLRLRNENMGIRERENTRRLQSSGESIKKLEKANLELEKQLFELEGRPLGRLRRDIGRGVTHVRDNANDYARGAFGRAAGGLPGFARGVAGVAMGGLGAVGGAAATVGGIGGGFERQRAALGTALGSDSAGEAAFEKVRQFAKETPFAVQEVTEAVTTLKVRGLAPTVEAAMEALKTYGDVAGAMGKDLKTVVEAVSDASVGEFERLKEAFNVVAHKSGDEVKFTFAGVTTTVKNDAQEIQKYLMSIGKTNFAGGMEKQSRTLLGAWSNLGDAVANFADQIYRNGLGDALKEVLADITGTVDGADNLAETFGGLLADAVRDAYRWLKDLIGPLDEMPEKLKSAWETGEKFLSIVGALVSAGASLASSFDSTTLAVGLFGAAMTMALGPMGLVAAAALATGAAIASMLSDADTGMQKLHNTAQAIRRKELQEEIDRKSRELDEGHAQMDEVRRRDQKADALGAKFIATELRKRGVSKIEDLPEKEQLALTRLQYGSIRALKSGDQRAYGGGDFDSRVAAFEADLSERSHGADQAEFKRLAAISSKKRTPAQEKRLNELSKTLDIKKPTGHKTKEHLTAFEEDQKHRIDKAVKDAEMRAGDEAILQGRGAQAGALAKTAGVETRERLKAAAARGEALPGQVDTAFARIVGYNDVVNAPPPPVMVIAPKFDVTVPLEVHGSFSGDAQSFSLLAVSAIKEALEVHILPEVALKIAPNWTR